MRGEERRENEGGARERVEMAPSVLSEQSASLDTYAVSPDPEAAEVNGIF